MSTTWNVLYRCRRCGAIDRSMCGSHEIVERAVMFAAIGSPRREPGDGHIVIMTSTHLCADGGYGVTDLIGGAPEPEAAPLSAWERFTGWVESLTKAKRAPGSPVKE
jgi:hypothetical protein